VPREGGYRWTVPEFWAELALYDTLDEAETLARERWEMANFGDVFGRLGWFWDGCPHWYASNASPAARSVVQEVFEIRRMCKAGAAAMMGRLTAAGAELLTMCDVYWTHLQTEHEKQLREERKRAANGS
jgi:hypothetical protein